MIDKLPPSNIEASEAIWGGILLDLKAISIVADILPAEAFSVQVHQQIYKAALELDPLSNRLTYVECFPPQA